MLIYRISDEDTGIVWDTLENQQEKSFLTLLLIRPLLLTLIYSGVQYILDTELEAEGNKDK